MNKSICCISSKYDWQECLKLRSLAMEKTGTDINILKSEDSIVDFEVIIYIHSQKTIDDTLIARWLKEASDLNRTFIPVILGGSWLSNKLLVAKYKGPNLRSSFLQLRKDEDMLSFCKTLVSASGQEMKGDAYGATVDFLFDIDCKIFEGNELIAEVPANEKTPIMLYLGVHTLTYTPKINCLSAKNDVIEIYDVEQHKAVNCHFLEEVLVKTDLECDVFQDNRFVAKVIPNEYNKLLLIAGNCRIRFQCITFEKTSKVLDATINHGENNPITAWFTVNVNVCSDIPCGIYQSNRLIGTIEENQKQVMPLIIGKSAITFKSIEFPDVHKKVKTIISDTTDYISVRFLAKIRLLSDIDCELFQNDILVGRLKSNRETSMRLFVGTCNLEFRSLEPKNISELKTVEINDFNDKIIIASFLVNATFKVDVNCIMLEDGKQIAFLKAFKPNVISVLKGLHFYFLLCENEPEKKYNVDIDAKENATYKVTFGEQRSLAHYVNAFLSSDIVERYRRLCSERRALRSLLWEAEKVNPKINSLIVENVDETLKRKGIGEIVYSLELYQNVMRIYGINCEIEEINDDALKRKGIIEVLNMLESPMIDVVGCLNRAPSDMIGLLTAIKQY